MRAMALPVGRHGSVWALLATVVVTTSVACTSSDGGGHSASSCVALVRYRNNTYSGTEAGDFTIGDELGAATIPPCDDTPNSDSDRSTKPTSTTAYAIKGVDPGIAIALGDAPDGAIFVNDDSVMKLPEIKKLINGS
ncbi:DUF6281 family protein [Streptomyces sp. NPDC002088]|uniref:DUF6281 family protein n=1 Tax=Streptomyces sp. NPDC002088 TaxID=3154665 RepID=UPI00331F2B5D